MFIYRNLHIRIVIAWLVKWLVQWNTTPEALGSNLGQHNKNNVPIFFSPVWILSILCIFIPLNWFFFLNIYRKKKSKNDMYCWVWSVLNTFSNPVPMNYLGGWSQQNHALWVASSADILLRYIYTLRLVGSISYLGRCYRHTKVTKCICQKMTLFSAVLISVCEPLNHIHQNTKSARLIAVCKRSITLNKLCKRARGCCVQVFLVYIYIYVRYTVLFCDGVRRLGTG